MIAVAWFGAYWLVSPNMAVTWWWCWRVGLWGVNSRWCSHLKVLSGGQVCVCVCVCVCVRACACACVCVFVCVFLSGVKFLCDLLGLCSLFEQLSVSAAEGTYVYTCIYLHVLTAS